MITNAKIATIVAANCPECFEEPYDVRGLIIPDPDGPLQRGARRYFIMRQSAFSFTELADLVNDFELAGYDADVNVRPCGELDMLVEAEVELRHDPSAFVREDV